MDSIEIKTDQILPEEIDQLAIEWLKRRSGIEGAVAVVVLPQDAWNTLYETLQMDAGSSAFDLELRKSISEALDQINEFNSDVGVGDG